MEFFTELFDVLGTRESIFVILWLFVAYLIGLLTHWLYTRPRFAKLRGELDAKINAYNDLQAKYKELQAQYDLKEADLKKANLEIDELNARIRQLEEEKGQLHGDLHATKLDLGTYKDEKTTWLNQEKDFLIKLESFDNQVVGLKSKNTALAANQGNPQAEADLADLRTKYAVANAKLGELEAKCEAHSDYDVLKANVGELQGKLSVCEAKCEAHGDYDSLKEKVGELEGKLSACEAKCEAHGDYDALKSKIGDLESENADMKQRLASNMQMATAAPILEEKSKDEIAADAQAEVKAALGTKIAVASEDEKDDLKLINGVGPFIEKKLNNLGIYTFEQISQFDDALSNTVTDAIEFFPGRIQRDDWVGQAKILMGKK
ncbi:MAG: hypothetical protein ACPG5P_07910, partial [Saprospiraceae bacterium]